MINSPAKLWYTSKMLWANAIALVMLAIQLKTGMVAAFATGIGQHRVAIHDQAAGGSLGLRLAYSYAATDVMQSRSVPTPARDRRGFG